MVTAGDFGTLARVLAGLAPPESVSGTVLSDRILFGSATARMEDSLLLEIPPSRDDDDVVAFVAAVRNEQARGLQRDEVALEISKRGYALACETRRGVEGDVATRGAVFLTLPNGTRKRCSGWVSLDQNAHTDAAIVRVHDPAIALALVLACRFGLFASPPAPASVCADLVIAFLCESETQIANERARLRRALSRPRARVIERFDAVPSSSNSRAVFELWATLAVVAVAATVLLALRTRF